MRSYRIKKISHVFAAEGGHTGDLCSKSCSSEGKIGQVFKIKQRLKIFKVNYAYAAVTISRSDIFFSVSSQFSLEKSRLTQDFGKKTTSFSKFT